MPIAQQKFYLLVQEWRDETFLVKRLIQKSTNQEDQVVNEHF